jgi:predicted alpha/beta-fold hydrolase
MTVPTLLVVASADPVVDPASSRAVLASCSDAIRVHWLDRGGHLGFPADLHLGVPGPFGLEYQAVSWLARQLRRAGD